MRARARDHHEHQGLRHLRPLRGHGPGRRRRMRGDAGRQPHLGGPLPPRDHRRLRPAPWCLGDGEHGELVFTSLTKEALPIIRYRTKDLTRLLPGTARPAHRRMGRITGRSDDMIILRGVNLFPSQIEEIALRIPELSPHFQLELTRPEGQRMDQLTVKIERREPSRSRAARRRPRSCSSRSRSTSAPPARSTSSSPARWSGPTASCAGSTTCAPRPDPCRQPAGRPPGRPGAD